MKFENCEFSNNDRSVKMKEYKEHNKITVVEETDKDKFAAECNNFLLNGYFTLSMNCSIAPISTTGGWTGVYQAILGKEENF